MATIDPKETINTITTGIQNLSEYISQVEDTTSSQLSKASLYILKKVASTLNHALYLLTLLNIDKKVLKRTVKSIKKEEKDFITFRFYQFWATTAV